MSGSFTGREKSSDRKEVGLKKMCFEKSLVRTGVWVPHISLFIARCGSTAKTKVKCSSRAYLDNNSEIKHPSWAAEGYGLPRRSEH